MNQGNKMSLKFAYFYTDFVHKSRYKHTTSPVSPLPNSDKSIKNDSFRRRNAVAHFSFMLFLLFSQLLDM